MSRHHFRPRLLCLAILTGAFALAAGIATGAQKQTAPAKAPPPAKTPFELDVAGGEQWVDSKVDLQPGDRLLITATGTLKIPNAKEGSTGPDGLPRAWTDLIRQLPVSEAGRGTLIGRIGSSEAALPFRIGSRREFLAEQSGRLFLGINQQANEAGEGKYHVKIETLERVARKSSGGGTLQPAKAVTPEQIPGLTSALFDQLPRRVSDKDGHPGDMVNFLILGSEQKVRQAFQAAGWVTVDRTKKEAMIHGLLSTLSKQAYTQLPMSELYLFDRPQDYGFAHAEPIAVVASRHHLRLWKAPFAVGGKALWVGAGTHDIGFDRDKRTKAITHKIDPAVDDERDYIRESLKETGIVAALTYTKPPNPVTEARTATGGSFHSDGQVLVLQLAGANDDRSSAFADLFCTVLQQEHPDAGEWGACAQYLAETSQRSVPLPPISKKYRLLIVPGVLSSCASSTPAYQEGQAHLREAHGLTVELMPVPNDSSEANGRLVAGYLKSHMRGDSRKFIVLGYSKGAPDVQLALATDPDTAGAVAAFLTVAGAVGGSPIADVMPAVANRWINALRLGECEGELSAAFRSLRHDERQAFLSSYPDPIVPTYSLATVSDKSNTSKMLLDNWQILAAYDSQQDSQLTKFDALVPGGVYLGSARADHWAVALPFEDLKDPEIAKLVDKNHYPRTALLEALVRFVTQDLDSAR